MSRTSSEFYPNDTWRDRLKTLNPFGEESPVRYDMPGFELTGNKISDSPARKDRTLFNQFPYWLKEHRLNPLYGWWFATYEILLGNHFDTWWGCFQNNGLLHHDIINSNNTLSKGVVDLLLLSFPLIARLLIVRTYTKGYPETKTPFLNFLNWIFFVGPIEVLRFSLGISLWISLFPVVMAFHMVKDVVDVFLSTSLEDLKSLLPWGTVALVPGKSERSLKEYIEERWKKDKDFFHAISSTFFLFNGGEIKEKRRKQGLLDWLILFRVGRKLLEDIKKDERSHTWFFNSFAFVLGQTLLGIQFILSLLLTSISIPGVFLVSLWKEISAISKIDFEPFSEGWQFALDFLKEQFFKPQTLKDGLKGLFKVLYGFYDESTWNLGATDVLLLGIPLISTYLQFMGNERIKHNEAIPLLKNQLSTPLLNFFSWIGIVLVEIPRWIGTAPFYLISIPFVMLVHLFKEMHTIYKNGVGEKTLSELFILNGPGPSIITVLLDFIMLDNRNCCVSWLTPCHFFLLILGDHYFNSDVYGTSYSYKGASIGLLDFLLLGLPLLSQKLIRDTYKDERNTTTLLNVAAWAVALPIEVIRYSVGVPLAMVSYFPVMGITLLGHILGGIVCAIGSECMSLYEEPASPSPHLSR